METRRPLSQSFFSTWRHFPWLLGLMLSPLLFGSVDPDGQAVVGALLGVSFLLLAPQMAASGQPPLSRSVWSLAAIALIFLPFIPLPIGLVHWIAPQREALALAFPIEPGTKPDWVTLTLSPAASLQRCWELYLVIAVFLLSRQAAQSRVFQGQWILGLTVSLVTLAASDLWFRTHGREKLLGIWQPGSGAAAGTFGNRNHFADWIYVASLFILGWILRQGWALQSARIAGQSKPPSARWQSGLLLGAVGFALFMAVSSGSRGGILSFGAGLLAWWILLNWKSRNRRRWLGLSLIALSLFLLLLNASEFLLGRLVLEAPPAEPSPNFKFLIWQDGLRIFNRFPLFGTGWGTFPIAFDLYKNFGGVNTFLHAENDYVELLTETGLAGLLVFFLPVARKTFHAVATAWRQPLPEPELYFGALAGLTAFAVHALCEFVFQIPATALLAAALFGFLAGNAPGAPSPAAPAPVFTRRLLLNFVCALVLLFFAARQATGFWWFQQSRLSATDGGAVRALRHSLEWWPWDSARPVFLLRAEAAMLGGLPAPAQEIQIGQAKAELQAALHRDPLNWNLRLERAWFDLAYSSNSARGRMEALEVVRLNPRQSKIPLHFARHFAQRDPATALQFLKAIPPAANTDLDETLLLDWKIENQTAPLWTLVPETPRGMMALGDFALTQNLVPLALQAYQRSKPPLAPLWVAEKLLAAGHPDRAIEFLPAPRSLRAEALASRAWFDLKNFPAAIRSAESIIAQARGGKELARSSPVANSADRATMNEAEEIFSHSPRDRDLNRLRALATRNSGLLRVQWMVFQSELELNLYENAARSGRDLALRLVAAGP